jgi:hypothetical protein
MIFNFRNWVLQNFPFLEDDFDALTDYELFCKMLEYVKNFAKDNEDFSKRLTDLENYINNLDLQDEVNTKLDEMAQDGTLADIIAQYVNLQSVLAYNTVSELKTANNIVNGSIVRTLGYTTYNDGNGSFYKVRNVTTSDIIDEINIIALNNPLLIAQKITKYTDNMIENIQSNYESLITYSQTEKAVGLWDDQHIIYRKIIHFGALPNNSSLQIPHGITNLMNVIRISGEASDGANRLPIPYVSAGDITTDRIAIFVDNNYVELFTFNDKSNYTNNFVILEYTKTN